METIINAIFSQLGVGGFVGLAGLLTGIFGWAFYKTLVNVFFTQNNIDKMGDAIKAMNERIADPKARKLTELKEAFLCVEILRDIGFGDILRPDATITLNRIKSGLE